MSVEITAFRRSEAAVYPHNVHITFEARRPIDGATAALLRRQFEDTDNYGLDKIRIVAIGIASVDLIVAVPPNRSLSQVAIRLKSMAEIRLHREGGATDKLFKRGYAAAGPLGSRTIGELRRYLAEVTR